MRSFDDTTPFRPTPSPAAVAVAGIDAPAVPGRRIRRSFFSEVWRWIVTVVLFLIVSVTICGFALLGAIYVQARKDQTRPVDAIIVLGAAQYNGRPSPILKARLDEALAAYNEGVAPIIVVTGGRQTGDQFTEASASRNYLVDHGVPRDNILLENDAHNSWESMQGAAALLKSRDLSRVLLVSDGFHLFRLKLMAKDLDLKAYGRPATKSPIKQNSGSEFSYVLREGGGVIAHLLGR
ncbi:MAG: YdcF family protein [Thermomicrobiales bacterium]